MSAMRKITLLLFVAFVTQSCLYDDIEYYGGKKEVFEGRLTDESGAPLAGIKVSAYISNGSDADIPGYDFTDENGQYKFVFPGVSKFDGDAPYVALLVNQHVYTQVLNPEFSSFTIHNIKFDRMVNHKIDFGTAALFRPQDATSLQINFLSESGTNLPPPAINLVGMVDRNFLDYNRSLLDLYSYYYNQADFSVAKNQTIILLYQPFNLDGSPGAIEEVEIPIGEDPVTYTITY